MLEREKNAVGTCIITAIDKTRDEKLGSKSGKRVVSARLYYPAEYDGEPQVVLKNAAGEMYQSPKVLDNGRYPLIIYNHGYGSYMEANNKLCCELVENGYFVASVGHAFESSPLELSDGSKIELDPSIRKRQINPQISGTVAALKMKRVKGNSEKLYESFYLFQKKYCMFLNERLREWSDDVRCIVDILKKDYSHYIDFEKGIGLTGHSFGGNLSYYMCMNYKEYVCGVNIDGAIFGEYSGQTMKRPFLQICNRGNVAVVSKALLNTDAPVEYEIFDGITHLGFTDMKFFHKSKLLMGKMSSEEMIKKLINLHLKFFDKYLR